MRQSELTMEETAASSTEPANEEERIAHLGEEERHILLESKRRRLVLDILRERSSSMDIDDLAVKVAKREDNLDPSREEDVKEIKIVLFHQHLPKMDSFDVLDFDPDRQRIVL